MRSELSNAQPGYAFPERELVPGPGSPRWEAMSEQAQERWREIRASSCIYCGRPLGEQAWMLSWPDGRKAHLGCQEDSIAAETALANNPFEIERAAKAAKITNEGFRLLPSWERLRLIRMARDEGKMPGR